MPWAGSAKSRGRLWAAEFNPQVNRCHARRLACARLIPHRSSALLTGSDPVNRIRNRDAEIRHVIAIGKEQRLSANGSPRDGQHYTGSIHCQPAESAAVLFGSNPTVALGDVGKILSMLHHEIE